MSTPGGRTPWAGAPSPSTALRGGADRHDDVDVIVRADRPEDPRRERAVELERDLVDLDVLEDVAQVPRVERDGRPVAFHGRIDLSLVVADVGRRGGRHRRIAPRPEPPRPAPG